MNISSYEAFLIVSLAGFCMFYPISWIKNQTRSMFVSMFIAIAYIIFLGNFAIRMNFIDVPIKDRFGFEIVIIFWGMVGLPVTYQCIKAIIAGRI